MSGGAWSLRVSQGTHPTHPYREGSSNWQYHQHSCRPTSYTSCQYKGGHGTRVSCDKERHTSADPASVKQVKTCKLSPRLSLGLAMFPKDAPTRLAFGKAWVRQKAGMKTI